MASGLLAEEVSMSKWSYYRNKYCFPSCSPHCYQVIVLSFCGAEKCSWAVAGQSHNLVIIIALSYSSFVGIVKVLYCTILCTFRLDFLVISDPLSMFIYL